MKMRVRQSDELYFESIGSFWGKLAVALFFGMGILFGILLFYQRAHGPIGENPSPDWFYIMMLCIFLVISLLVINFISLTVIVTSEGIMVAYGLFRRHVAWDNLAGYELNKGSAFWQFGGYGIRLG